MKNVFLLKYGFLALIMSLLAVSGFAQSKSITDELPPENFYVTPVGAATWDSIISDDFQLYKLWLNGAFIADIDTNFYQYGANGEDLVSGEIYLAEIQALYNNGLSEKVEFQWTYFPCDSFANHTMMDAYNPNGSDEVIVIWSDQPMPELIEINQGYGDAVTSLYQEYNYGYGVVFDIAEYPDAIVHSVNFYHLSWDVLGNWDYMIHIIDWDNKQTIATIGPFQTTGNDTWESDILLGDIDVEGISEIGIFMEPMSHDDNDAYPSLAADNFDDSQGSTIINLSNLQEYSSSDAGNFLLSMDIYTMNGKNRETLTLGTNIYMNDSIIAFVPSPDTFYIIEEPPQYGYWDLCISTVYSDDGGNHNWTSCYGELCMNDIGICWPCLPPENLEVNEIGYGGDYIMELFWDTPEDNPQQIIGYHIIRDNLIINDIPVPNTYYLDTVASPGMFCYEVTSVYSECISEVSNEYCTFPWSVNNIDSEVLIYPNPAQNFLIIEAKSNINTIKMTNSLGQVYFPSFSKESQQIRIETSSINAGVYLLIVETKQGIKKAKVIIQ